MSVFFLSRETSETISSWIPDGQVSELSSHQVVAWERPTVNRNHNTQGKVCGRARGPRREPESAYMTKGSVCLCPRLSNREEDNGSGRVQPCHVLGMSTGRGDSALGQL